jgi:hypothetical protein
VIKQSKTIQSNNKQNQAYYPGENKSKNKTKPNSDNNETQLNEVNEEKHKMKTYQTKQKNNSAKQNIPKQSKIRVHIKKI